MNKLEKPVKGKNIKYLLDAFFNKYIRKHFNQVNSIDFIISDLGERMADGGRNIKILRNDNPVRTNNPDWFPPKAQQTDHICTFLKQLIDNELGTKDSYVGLKAEVVTENETYTWDVRAVDYYASSGTVILRTDPRQGVTIECPAIVRLYIYPLLTSKAVSSIIYNSIVTSESKYNFILGERNIHKGKDNVWIFGKNNVSGETNHNSLIDGYNNDVDSYGNIVIGDSNKHRSLLGATIGKYIKNFKQNSFLFGTGHDNTNGPSHEVVFGKYSNIEADTAFAIGDGEDENNRHNLFEVKYGGAILDKDGNDLRNRGGQQVQSDWNENDNTKPAFINNKPFIYENHKHILYGVSTLDPLYKLENTYFSNFTIQTVAIKNKNNERGKFFKYIRFIKAFLYDKQENDNYVNYRFEGIALFEFDNQNPLGSLYITHGKIYFNKDDDERTAFVYEDEVFINCLTEPKIIPQIIINNNILLYDKLIKYFISKYNNYITNIKLPYPQEIGIIKLVNSGNPGRLSLIKDDGTTKTIDVTDYNTCLTGNLVYTTDNFLCINIRGTVKYNSQIHFITFIVKLIINLQEGVVIEETIEPFTEIY